MQDVNDAIDILNSLLVAGGSPLQMDKIKSGPSFGAGVRMLPSHDVRLSFDYERLTGSSKIQDASGSIELSVPANSFSAGVTYLFPSQSRTRFGFGGGLGLYVSDGSEKDVAAGSSSQEFSWSGSGLGFNVLGQAETALSKEIRLELGAGYRYAKADLKIEGSTTNAQLDWSGFSSRIGLAFYPK
jgi:hypothetical protein